MSKEKNETGVLTIKATDQEKRDLEKISKIVLGKENKTGLIRLWLTKAKKEHGIK
jgi:hypothetical protein